MEKVVLITGGTRGIGLGIAKQFLKNGYKAALNYLSRDESLKLLQEQIPPDKVIFVKADITQKKNRERLLAEVVNHFGRLDVLVNNAGIIRKDKLVDLDEDEFTPVIQCNLHAPIFLGKAFANYLIQTQNCGSIINVLSVGAYRTGNLAYCTSKAGLLMATKCMARELAKYHIRVNSVSPFGVETELNRANREKNPEVWDKLIKKSAFKRSCDPEEIGSVVLFLASDAASYITGTDIPVDGGFLCK